MDWRLAASCRVCIALSTHLAILCPRLEQLLLQVSSAGARGRGRAEGEGRGGEERCRDDGKEIETKRGRRRGEGEDFSPDANLDVHDRRIVKLTEQILHLHKY